MWTASISTNLQRICIWSVLICVVHNWIRSKPHLCRNVCTYIEMQMHMCKQTFHMCVLVARGMLRCLMCASQYSIKVFSGMNSWLTWNTWFWARLFDIVRFDIILLFITLEACGYWSLCPACPYIPSYEIAHVPVSRCQWRNRRVALNMVKIGWHGNIWMRGVVYSLRSPFFLLTDLVDKRMEIHMGVKKNYIGKYFW